MRPMTKVRRFRQETKYPHKRSDGLRSTKKHATRDLIRPPERTTKP